jgi:predicted peroxiredoxin
MSKIFMKSSWGSDDPTRASMIFEHGNALAEAGHEVRIFLLGDANVLARSVVRENIFPIGWPPLTEHWDRSLELGISIECCGACAFARGVTEEQIEESGAFIGSPKSFVESVEWSDKIIAE